MFPVQPMLIFQKGHSISQSRPSRGHDDQLEDDELFANNLLITHLHSGPGLSVRTPLFKSSIDGDVDRGTSTRPGLEGRVYLRLQLEARGSLQTTPYPLINSVYSRVRGLIWPGLD